MQKKEDIFEKIKKLLPKRIEAADNPTETEYLSPIEVKRLDFIHDEFNRRFLGFKEKEKEKFLFDFLVRFTYNTNAIEENRLTLSDTEKILSHRFVKKNWKSVQEVENSRQAFDFVMKHRGDINKKFIFDLHKTVMKKIVKNPGLLRDHDVELYGSFYMPTDKDLLELEFEELITWYNENKMHPFELACIFHLNFVSMHPFMDGNGRMARLLFNYILWKAGYPMMVFPVSKKRSYFDSLEECHLEESPQAFIDWVMKVYIG
ncbi:MAG: Fic family protein [Nanoarchaeota archaeon]|nr:Fic family protein [Nanoarchaeota archaeon]